MFDLLHSGTDFMKHNWPHFKVTVGQSLFYFPSKITFSYIRGPSPNTARHLFLQTTRQEDTPTERAQMSVRILLATIKFPGGKRLKITPFNEL